MTIEQYNRIDYVAVLEEPRRLESKTLGWVGSMGRKSNRFEVNRNVEWSVHTSVSFPGISTEEKQEHKEGSRDSDQEMN